MKNLSNLNNVFNTDKMKSLFDNDIISQLYEYENLLPLFAVSITLYSVMVTPKLHSDNLEIFNNIFFKLALVIIIYYITTHNKLVGLALSIGILFTIFGLNYNNSIYKISTTNDNNNLLPFNNNSYKKSSNILLSSEDNDIITRCLSDRQMLVNKLNDNTVLPNVKSEINNKVLVNEHVIDSILKATEHVNNISDDKSKEECHYHNDRASKYKIKSKSLLNTIKLRDLLNQNLSEEDIKKILILLTHENNKVDLINNINNEYDNILNNNNVEEHFSNINDYCIDLENKLKLDNMDNIINYYSNNNTNIRQSNDLDDLNNLNIDDTNSLYINDNMNYQLLNDTKCNYN